MKPASDALTPDGGQQASGRPEREQLTNLWLSEQDDAVIVTVRGELDGFTAPRLRSVIVDAFGRLSGRPLIVDLAEVTFLGSAGLRTLLESAEEAADHAGFQPLRIVVHEARPVIRPIEIVGLDHVLALYHSVDHALAGDLRP